MGVCVRVCVCGVCVHMCDGHILTHSCIKDDWNSEKVDSTGVDFDELEDGFREEVQHVV